MQWIDGVEYCNHGHEMTASNTRIVKDRHKLYKRCRTCLSLLNKRRRMEIKLDPELSLQYKTYQTAWRARNPDLVAKGYAKFKTEKAGDPVYRAMRKQMALNWHKTNPGKSREQSLRRASNLEDAYIRGLLFAKKGELPQEIIELKKLELTLKREISKCQQQL